MSAGTEFQKLLAKLLTNLQTQIKTKSLVFEIVYVFCIFRLSAKPRRLGWYDELHIWASSD